nr:uncharacterized protein LOC128699872 [Cherax quadricarinatus]
MDILLASIDNWDRSDYKHLKQAGDALSTNEENASQDDSFSQKIDKDNFSNYVQTVQSDVQNGQKSVDAKLTELKKIRTDRVIFVSVISSVGGLMIVAIAAEIIFSSYKRYNTSKESSLNKSSDKEEYMENASPSPKSTQKQLTNPNDIYTRPHAPKDDRHYSARDYKDIPSGRRDPSSRHDPYTRNETNHRTSPYPTSSSKYQQGYSRDSYRD